MDGSKYWKEDMGKFNFMGEDWNYIENSRNEVDKGNYNKYEK